MRILLYLILVLAHPSRYMTVICSTAQGGGSGEMVELQGEGQVQKKLQLVLDARMEPMFEEGWEQETPPDGLPGEMEAEDARSFPEQPELRKRKKKKKMKQVEIRQFEPEHGVTDEVKGEGEVVMRPRGLPKEQQEEGKTQVVKLYPEYQEKEYWFLKEGDNIQKSEPFVGPFYTSAITIVTKDQPPHILAILVDGNGIYDEICRDIATVEEAEDLKFNDHPDEGLLLVTLGVQNFAFLLKQKEPGVIYFIEGKSCKKRAYSRRNIKAIDHEVEINDCEIIIKYREHFELDGLEENDDVNRGTGKVNRFKMALFRKFESLSYPFSGTKSLFSGPPKSKKLVSSAHQN